MFAFCHDLQEKNITIVVYTHADLQSNTTLSQSNKINTCVCVFLKLENVCRLCAGSAKQMEFSVFLQGVGPLLMMIVSASRPICASFTCMSTYRNKKGQKGVDTNTQTHLRGHSMRLTSHDVCLAAWAIHIWERWFRHEPTERLKKRLATHLNH